MINERLMYALEHKRLIRLDRERQVFVTWNGSSIFEAINPEGDVVAHWSHDRSDHRRGYFSMQQGDSYLWASGIIDDVISGRSFSDRGEPFMDYLEAMSVE